MTVPFWAWPALSTFVVAMLAFDLFLHRRPRAISLREAGIWSAVWLGLGLAFGLVVWRWLGSQAAGEYLAGYLVEYSLSIDNLFVFAMIFSAFTVPALAQHRVLLFGIAGALVFRLLFILAGSTMITRFHWAIYVFGAFLVLTGIRMGRPRKDEPNPERNPILQLIRRVLPISAHPHFERFFVREDGRLKGTTLFVAVAALATTDVIFAVDSVPAIFAITLNPFIVFSATAFALLGLRTLYVLLAGMLRRFAYLQAGLAVLLVLVGIKMLVSDLYQVPIWMSLSLIVSTLSAAILASLLRGQTQRLAKETVSRTIRNRHDEDFDRAIPPTVMLGARNSRHHSRTWTIRQVITSNLGRR